MPSKRSCFCHWLALILLYCYGKDRYSIISLLSLPSVCLLLCPRKSHSSWSLALKSNFPQEMSLMCPCHYTTPLHPDLLDNTKLHFRDSNTANPPLSSSHSHYHGSLLCNNSTRARLLLEPDLGVHNNTDLIQRKIKKRDRDLSIILHSQWQWQALSEDVLYLTYHPK